MNHTITSDKKIFYSVLTVVFVATLIIGSFFDYEIATAVYLPKNIFSLAVTILELYFFHGAFVFLIGILLGQFFSSGMNKIPSAVICGYLALSTSVLGAVGLLSPSCYGEIFSRKEFSFLHFLIVGIIIFYPLFFLGFGINKKHSDKTVIKKIIILLCAMTIAFFLPVIVKEIFCRPRYRIVSSGYDGIDFTPWYFLFGESDLYQKRYNLAGDDFGSFFSGHAVMAMTNFVILSVLTEVFPAMKKRENIIFIVTLIMFVATLISRMLLGAHYLTDVSFGALVGIIINILYLFFERRFINAEKTGL